LHSLLLKCTISSITKLLYLYKSYSFTDPKIRRFCPITPFTKLTISINCCIMEWKKNILLKCSHEKPFKVCRYFTWFCTNRQYAYFYKLSEITLKRITIDKKDKSTYKRHENIGQYIKHKFLFPIVCFSASINDFHLNISAGGLLLKLGPISLTHRYPILPILFKPV